MITKKYITPHIFISAIVTAIVSIFFTVLLAHITFATSGAIGGRPAQPTQDNPRTHSIFIHTIDKGSSINDGLLLVNGGSTTDSVNIYAVDSTITSTGSITCKQKVEDKEGVGSWVKLTKSEVTLKPDETKVVPFTISVPNKNIGVGEHDGCIVIEPIVDGNSTGGGITIRTRSAIRVIVIIPGIFNKDLSIPNFRAYPKGGNYNYDVSVKNTGNVSVDADIHVRLTSLTGRTVYMNGGRYPIFPNVTLDLAFVDEKPPIFGGFFWADAEATYDSSKHNTTGDQTGKNIITKHYGKKLVFFPPTVTGLLIIIVALIVLVGTPTLIIRRYLKKMKMVREGKLHIVADGETIKRVAEKYNTSWKTLVALNNIKAPFEISKGDSLLVPEVAFKKKTKKSKTKKSSIKSEKKTAKKVKTPKKKE